MQGYLSLTFLMAALLAGAACLAAPGRDGLLLEYRLDGDLQDTSGGGHHGRLNGTPTFAAGPAGRCLVLDGKGAWLDSGTNLPELTDTFTIECWVKPAAAQNPYADVFGNHANEFVGFALQQDGTQANCYYFTYGTGKQWRYSRTIPLAAGEWQHVGIVKTPDRLRFYLNGLLADSRPAPEPMAPSKTPFMVGLGIAGQQRWFNGSIADVRVWRRASTFQVALPAEKLAAQFARTGAVEAEASSRWGLFPARGDNGITFRLEPEAVPAAIESVDLAFDCRNAAGAKVPWAGPLHLRRAEGFQASVPVPALPGYHQLSWRPSFAAGGRRQELAAGRMEFVTLTPEGGVPAPAARRGRTKMADAMPATLPLNGEWQVATDPQNQGREGKWWEKPAADAQSVRVPGILQEAFPGTHGVAWYWRDFTAPAAPKPGSRYLLRFEAVDYKADVWLNGTPVGGHEGGETPFELDVTPAIRAGVNRVAVRVLNPTHQPIDGMTLNQTPRRAKVIPYSAGASYDHGGIVGAVELAVVPAVYLTDLYARTDPRTGAIHVQATLRNAGTHPAKVRLEASVAPAAAGETVDAAAVEQTVAPGETTVEAELRVAHPRLWDVKDPFLYRVTARAEAGGACDERSVRCGFRDFRFENGYFRLNGRRLFLRSAHTVNAAPVGQQVPADPELFRRDILTMKTMGFNCIRFIWGGATAAQLDLCDEMGLMVYQEHAASNPMEDGPHMAERFDRSVSETIRRDRNHPSVVIWGLLNETFDGPVFRHATRMLPLVRSLDETRMVMLNSGRWDGQRDIGSICNPGAAGWDGYLGGEGPGAAPSGMGGPGGYCREMGDAHVYPRVPHTADTIAFLRTLGQDTGPVFLSEYGIGSAVDLWRVTRRFEQIGKPDAEDAAYYRERLDRFLADWDRWKLGECFADPQAFFAASLKKMAGQRTLGLDAIRANPRIVGHNVTGMMDHVNCGEGLFTLFRDLKPGTTDAMYEAFAPLRLCLFAEPANSYRGGSVRLEAVLANEDALPAGEYPVRLQVIGPGMQRPFDKTVSVTVPEARDGAEPPLAIPFFAEDVRVDGPSGAYRFLATMERGGAPTGGETAFYLGDPASLPRVEGEVTLCGADAELADWLQAHGVRARPFGSPAGAREVILVGAGAPSEAEWQALAERVRQGATAVFLCPEVFRSGDDPVGRLPLQTKGTLVGIHGWLYLKDEWAKAHPVFDGLPAGGLMDTTYYREIIPDLVFAGQEPPAEAVAGAIKASQDYASGLMLAVYDLGAGRLVLNTLQIRQNLGRHPAADRLLANLLRYAERKE